MKRWLIFLLFLFSSPFVFAQTSCINARPLSQALHISQHRFGPTEACDHLWSIARTYARHESISTHKAAIAIWKKNPRAFVRRNMNLLKPGYMLKLPTRAEMKRVSMSQAAHTVRMQKRHLHMKTKKVAKKSVAAPANKPAMRMLSKPNKAVASMMDSSKSPVMTQRPPVERHLAQQGEEHLVTAQVMPQHMMAPSESMELKLQNQSLQEHVAKLLSEQEGYQQHVAALTLQVQRFIGEQQVWGVVSAQQQREIKMLHEQVGTLAHQLEEQSQCLVRTPKWFDGPLARVNNTILNLSNRYSIVRKFFSLSTRVRLFFAAGLTLLLLILEIVQRIRQESEDEQDLESMLLDKCAQKRGKTNYKYLSGEDLVATKLDLAHAYIDMDDIEHAKETLNSVLSEGNEAQKEEAKQLLEKISKK